MQATLRATTASFGTLAAAAVVGVGVALAPAPVIGGVTAISAALLAWTRPKATVAVVAIVVLLSRMASEPVPALASIDEAAVLGLLALTVAKIAVGMPMRGWVASKWLAAFLAAGAVSALAAEVPARIAALDGFLLVKGAVFGWCVAQYDWTERDLVRAWRIAAAFGVVVLAAVAANLAAPGPWNAAFSVASDTAFGTTRGGFVNPIGPFGAPGFLAQFATLAAVLVGAHIAVFGATWRTIAALVIATGLTAVTLRRKAAAGLLAALTAVGLWNGRTRAVTFVAVAFVLPAIALVQWDLVARAVDATAAQYIDGNSYSPRSIFYSGAADLAAANFPLGAGLGRYGTYTAWVEYSPVYYELGFSTLYGLTPEEGQFATDTWWPAILGETGVLGLLAFAAALLALLRQAVRLAKRSAGWVRVLALAAAGWWIAFLIESIASPAYNVPPNYVLFFGVFGLVQSFSRR